MGRSRSLKCMCMEKGEAGDIGSDNDEIPSQQLVNNPKH